MEIEEPQFRQIKAQHNSDLYVEYMCENTVIIFIIRHIYNENKVGRSFRAASVIVLTVSQVTDLANYSVS